jgi:hypothetical protein
MKVTAFNKVLKDSRPLDEICSADEARWITAKVRHEGKYEDEFHIFTKGES